VVQALTEWRTLTIALKTFAIEIAMPANGTSTRAMFFLHDLELPRGPEREFVVDGDHRYELNGNDSRSLAAVGAFWVVAERDLRDPRQVGRPT
jgi:hypothetical protein